CARDIGHGIPAPRPPSGGPSRAEPMYVQHVATIAGGASAGIAPLAGVTAGLGRPATDPSTDPDALVGEWYATEAPALQRYVRSLVRDADKDADVRPA